LGQTVVERRIRRRRRRKRRESGRRESEGKRKDGKAVLALFVMAIAAAEGRSDGLKEAALGGSDTGRVLLLVSIVYC
jgi:hypothetical protein